VSALGDRRVQAVVVAIETDEDAPSAQLPLEIVAGFLARLGSAGPIVGWVALTAYSARRVYSGVAWESVYVAEDHRGRGVGRALLEALVKSSEKAGFWTLLAGVMIENEASLALHERCGFDRVGVMRAMGRDAAERWRDVALLERRSRKVGI